MELEVYFRQFKQASRVFRAINNELRRQILIMLHRRERMSVKEVYYYFNIDQPAASQHLSILRSVGLVNTTREGKFVFYSVNYEKFKSLQNVASVLEGKISLLQAKRAR